MLPIVARMELLACWAVWGYPFVFRAPHGQKRPSVTVPGPTRVGVLLEVAGIGLASFPARTPRTSLVALGAALVLGICGAVLSWTAVRHLGKQFRIHAGLYIDHELVQTGPYALVRHPIYASMLALLAATIVLLTPWALAAIVLALWTAGTEIRVRSEERLLASRFGEQFADYQRRVPAYLPFVR